MSPSICTAVAVFLAASGAVFAQASAEFAAGPSSPASAAASGVGLNYRSAFDGYRGFAQQPVVSWRGANDLVGRIGGWQAYAREGQGGAGSEPVKAPPAAKPAAPAASAPPPTGHSEHKKP
jgi:hypothetical protein